MVHAQTPLGQALAAAIAERGPITFADYMQIALYHPDGGYYANAATPRQGWHGDYITSVEVHPFFAIAIGRHLAEMWDLLGQPDPFVVLEDGAGRGVLGSRIARWASNAAGDAPAGFAVALRYLMRDQRGTWRHDPDGGEVQVVEHPAPHAILSNELADAFPVHIVERAADGLAEVYVDATGVPPQLIQRLGPLSSAEATGYLDRFRIPWQRMPVGWRAEIPLAAEAWMARAAGELAPRGSILTIDYGDTARRLYSADRRCGTLTAYFQQQISEDPLLRTGEQDLTAHVNFTALIRAGRAHGLRLIGLTTQRAFLHALGLREYARDLESRFPLAMTARHTDAGQHEYLQLMTARHALAALADPHGMGAFRVLGQQRGLPGARKHLRGWQGEDIHSSAIEVN